MNLCLLILLLKKCHLFAVLAAHAVKGDESKSFITFNRLLEL